MTLRKNGILTKKLGILTTLELVKRINNQKGNEREAQAENISQQALYGQRKKIVLQLKIEINSRYMRKRFLYSL